MIIDLPDFKSVNRLADMAPGRYLVVESVYRSGDESPCHAVLSELMPARSGRAVGADLQVVLHDGTTLFRDFAVARDGGWRDSYGARAATLAEPLPPELARFSLVERKAVLVAHDGKGHLILVVDPEAPDGP